MNNEAEEHFIGSDPRVLIVNAYTQNSALAYTKEKIGDEVLNFILPSSPAMFLNLALQAKEQVDEICKGELFSNSQDFKWPRNSRVLFDFFESMMMQIIFSYSAIEAFANTNIPDNHIYRKKNNGNRCMEEYNKEQTERFVNLDEKLTKVLPEILNVSSPAGTEMWKSYDELQKLRDRIIHLKSSDTNPSKTINKTIWGDLIRHQGTDFPNQIHVLIGHFVKNDKEYRWYNMFPY